VYKVGVEGSPQYGPATAPIVIVLFGDFESRESREADAMIHQVARAQEGKVRFAWKNLTVGRSAGAQKAAILGLLAAQHDEFVQVHDSFLAGKADPLTDDKLIALAQSVGISEQDVRGAWKDPDYKRKVAADRFMARRFGIHRGPALFVNGRFAKLPVTATA